MLLSTPAHAAITVNSLTSGTSSADATTYATSAFTATNNCLVLAGVHSRRASGSGSVVNATIPDAGGLTWEEVAVVEDGVNRQIIILRSMASSASSSAQTLTFTGETQSQCSWSIAEFCGVDTSGTNGSGAIVQAPTGTTGTGTSSLITLSALTSASNLAYGLTAHAATSATAPGTDFTEIHEQPQAETGSNTQTEYKLNETSVTTSWSGSVSWMALAAEIKAEGGSLASNLDNMFGVFE